MAASSAALCSVSVSNDVLENDRTVKLLLKIVEIKTHQVQVNFIKGKSTLNLTVAGNTLQQRNAILRSIVGAALHGAVDQCNFGCLAGGLLSTSASQHGTSLQAAANSAAMLLWMSAADELRKTKDSSQVLVSLDALLQESAFTLPFAPLCSLADLDLGIALLELPEQPDYPPAVTRWLFQVAQVVQEMAKETNIDLKLQLPTIPNHSQAPIFFYGTEDADAVLSALYHGAQKQQQAKNKSKVEKKQEAGKEQKMKEKKPKKEAIQAPAAAFDAMSLDIRVGKIVKVWPHESADKLFCEEIDLGGEIRQIASGLRPFYKDSDLQDRIVLVLCNLKKRNLVGFPSHGMVLCASNADHSVVEFVVPPAGSKLGERVFFEGLKADAPPEPESIVAKKKVFEAIAPDLKTDESGNVVWKTHVAKTSTGIIRALNKMPNASVS